MKDEILEKMLAAGSSEPGHPHDFDGISAVGQWVVCERTAQVTKSRGGIIAPQGSELPIWTVVSAGTGVEVVLGRKIGPGDRLLFQNPSATMVMDGRGFALMRATDVIAVLAMPDIVKHIVVPKVIQ
jgi:co-chaperonin GroES (HSP10)